MRSKIIIIREKIIFLFIFIAIFSPFYNSQNKKQLFPCGKLQSSEVKPRKILCYSVNNEKTSIC